MDRFLTKITAWAQSRPDIKSLILVGSRARIQRPADNWSDYDIIMLVDNPQYYIKNKSWLSELGQIVLSFIEKCTIGDSFEHRVLFNNGQDVDFIIEPVKQEKASSPAEVSPEVLDVYGRGYRILLDKIGLASVLEKLLSTARTNYTPPSLDSFRNVINDFFYHCIWAVKKLMRGELWTAKHCLNGYMQKNCLLKMIKWHTRTRNTQNVDTWFSGRFMEKWADPKVIGRLNKIDARYEAKDLVRALYDTMTLFSELARDTATHLHYTYNKDTVEWVRNWIKKTTANLNLKTRL